MKKLSKIIIFTGLLVSRVIVAQEFYTCVPKKDWWIDIVREGSKKEWELVEEIKISYQEKTYDIYVNNNKFKLFSKYKVVLKAGEYKFVYDSFGNKGESDIITIKNEIYISFSGYFPPAEQTTESVFRVLIMLDGRSVLEMSSPKIIKIYKKVK